MAQRLSEEKIAELLLKTVSSLKPGDLDDLRAALDVRHVTKAGGAGSSPDSARAHEVILNTLLPFTTTTSTTSTSTTTHTTTTTTSTTTSTTTTTSDKRLKRNIQLLANIMGLGIYSYNFVGSSMRVVGMMAQEVYEKYPQAVVVGGDDPAVNPWKINYGKLLEAVGTKQAGLLRCFLPIPATV